MTRVFNKSEEKLKRKRLRNNMPLAEIILWSKLKGKNMGYKFRRQYSVGEFVIDFYCPELKLAIEIDGCSHFIDEAEVRDKERQMIIESYGFTFLRFTNEEIYNNIDGVLTKIMQITKELTFPAPPW